MNNRDQRNSQPAEEPGAQLVRVIRTTLLRRGKGSESSPVRRVVQFWAPDGALLAEDDPCSELPADALSRELAQALATITRLRDLVARAEAVGAYAVAADQVEQPRA